MQRRLDTTNYTSFGQLEAELFDAAGDRLKCSFTPNLIKTPDGCFDRAPDNLCSAEWELQPGDTLTSVSFHKYDWGTSESACPREAWMDELPSRGLPMHTELFILGAPHGLNATSCYSVLPITTNQTLDGDIEWIVMGANRDCSVGGVYI